MFNESFSTKIEGEDINNIWFQQDSATCHTAEAPCFWRSHYQPQSWCRLATSELQFDIVRLLLDLDLADKPETIDALKDNIRDATAEIQLHTIDNVLKSWTGRGSHLNEIICHYWPKGLYFQIKKEIWENIQ